MTQALECPKCGAPLNFEPHPGEETIECPYCHETVIIPKELRIPLPWVVVQHEPPPAPAKKANRAAIAIGASILIVVCIIVIVLGNNSSDSTDTSSSFNSSSSDTAAPLSAADAATATVEARATDAALFPILTQALGWPANFTDNFTDNSHKWDTGDVRDSYINGNRTIEAGTYTWNITTVQSASDFSFPEMSEVEDFYASVDMNLAKMPPDDADADAGMVFRYNSTDQTWYYFSVNDRGQYYFGWYDGSDWYTLIPETDSPAIKVGQINRLAVAAQGSQFIFVINGQMVDHFIDENLTSGTVGLGINLPQTGEKATVVFSNFSVLSLTTK